MQPALHSHHNISAVISVQCRTVTSDLIHVSFRVIDMNDVHDGQVLEHISVSLSAWSARREGGRLPGGHETTDECRVIGADDTLQRPRDGDGHHLNLPHDQCLRPSLVLRR